MLTDELPVELWTLVSSYLSQSDRARLVRVNHRFHDILNRKLYLQSIRDDASDCVTHALKTGNLDTLKRAYLFGADIHKAYAVAPLPWGPRGDENLDRMTTWGTPLYQAAAGGRYEMVKWLLDQNVDVDGPGRNLCYCMPIGKTALGQSFPSIFRPARTSLHVALCQRHSSVARLLLSAGASLTTQLQGVYAKRKSPYWDPEVGAETCPFVPPPARGTRPWAIDALKSSSPCNALHDAARAGNLEVMTDLVRNRGLSVDSRDDKGATPIHYACEYRPSERNVRTEREVVSHLLSLGADAEVSFGYEGSYMMVALQFAIAQGHIEAAKQLMTVEDSFWTAFAHNGPKISLLKLLLPAMIDTTRRKCKSVLDSFAQVVADFIRETQRTHRPEYAPLVGELQSTFLFVCEVSCSVDRDCMDILRPFMDVLDFGDKVTLEQNCPFLKFIRRGFGERNGLWRATFPLTMPPDKEQDRLSGSSLGMLALCVTIGVMDWDYQGRALTTLNWLMTQGANPIGMRDTDPDPSLTPFVYLMKKITVGHPRESEPLTFVLGSIGPFVRLLVQKGAWIPCGEDDIGGVVRVYKAWEMCVRDLHERPETAPEWAFAIHDAFDYWSDRPKVEEVLRQHGLIDEDTCVDYEQSEVWDEETEEETEEEAL
ncbi:hypothetical protein CABS01_02222 [Colletotrichum abscissum]|uniref:F-box domain-containing protein n=1 Tax=Colletotrichum abscissum TaxID=1671311 RepID=A0A9P9XH74_9PEZI|nr:uncharacterized protein CABS01_02222 [Colletotrichum abscissum]KAI3554426.1 hypothetical protein CABS02_05243 [Colletotrichum abscissum]KAK1488592.1 hypothetical protein CABS01_02222 [Colletotrichum abscissum]